MSHLPLDARAILEYLNELGYRNISAEQLKEFMKGMQRYSETGSSKGKNQQNKSNESSNSNTQQDQQPHKLSTTKSTSATATTAATKAERTACSPKQQQQQQHQQQQHKNQQQPQQKPRTSIRIIKSKKPLIHFKFYLDICDNQAAKKVENRIKQLGGSLEFFLTPSVTHFITDKVVLPPTVGNNNNTLSSRPGTPQTPLTPLTPQTPYSHESLNSVDGKNNANTKNAATATATSTATASGSKRTTSLRQTRADAILSRARRSAIAPSTNPANDIIQRSNSPKVESNSNQQQQQQQQPYVVWQTEQALRFFSKVQNDLKDYLEGTRERKSHGSKSSSSGPFGPTYLKGSFIKIESLKRNYRPYYQLFKKPIEWPKIELTRDDGAFRLSPKKEIDFESEKKRMTRKSRSRSSQRQHEVEVLKKNDDAADAEDAATATKVVNSVDSDQKAASNIGGASCKLQQQAKQETRESEKQCGVCEICKIEYDTLTIHLKTKDHEFFAKNPQNFLALDTLIQTSADLNKFLKEDDDDEVKETTATTESMELEEMEVEEQEQEQEGGSGGGEKSHDSLEDCVQEKAEDRKSCSEDAKIASSSSTAGGGVRERSKRITKGKHSSEKFQNKVQRRRRTSSKSPKGAAAAAKPKFISPKKTKALKINISTLNAPAAAADCDEETNASGDIASPGVVTRKQTTAASVYSPPMRAMLPPSSMYKVVDTIQQNAGGCVTPAQRKLQGADPATATIGSPSLIVKFKKVRQAEMCRLSGEADNFMFRKQRSSSELPTDLDRQTTSDHLRANNSNASSTSLESSSMNDSMGMELESEKTEGCAMAAKPPQPPTGLNKRAIAIGKRRSVKMPAKKIKSETNPKSKLKTTAKSSAAAPPPPVNKQRFPAAPIQPENQLKTARKLKGTSNNAIVSTQAEMANFHEYAATRQLAVPEATRKSSRTATAIVTAATKSSRLLRAAVEAAKKANSENGSTTTSHRPSLGATQKTQTTTSNDSEIMEAPTSEKTVVENEVTRSGKSSSVVTMEDRMGDTTIEPLVAENDDSIISNSQMSRARRNHAAKAIPIHLGNAVDHDDDDDDDDFEEDDDDEEDEDDGDEDFIVNSSSVRSKKSNFNATTVNANISPSATREERAARRWNQRMQSLDILDNIPAEILKIDVQCEPEKRRSCGRRKVATKVYSSRGSKSKCGPTKQVEKASSSSTSPPKKVAHTSPPQRVFDISKSERIPQQTYAFERVPATDLWYRVYTRQDTCQERYFEYYGSRNYRKLPYEMGPIPFELTLAHGAAENCKLCSNKIAPLSAEPKKTEIQSKVAVVVGGSAMKIKREESSSSKTVSAEQHTKDDDVTERSLPQQGTTQTPYAHKHKKLHLLQRYRQEQQEQLHQEQLMLLQKQQEREQEQQESYLERHLSLKLKCDSKASTPERERERERAGSTHSTTSSCCTASSSATLNSKYKYRNKHLNKAALMNLELPPRKSPREHASTLALVSCLIRQRQDSMSKTNSETDEPAPASAPARAPDSPCTSVPPPPLPPALCGEALPLKSESPSTPAAPAPEIRSPRSIRSAAATPVEELRFATEISENVKRMRRGQNKYDHSPPIVLKKSRPSRGKCKTSPTAASPFDRRTFKVLNSSAPAPLTAMPSKNTAATPDHSRRPRSLLLQSRVGVGVGVGIGVGAARKSRPLGRPPKIAKPALPSVRKTGSKKGVLEFEMDAVALNALKQSMAPQKSTRQLEWEIDKFLELSGKDYSCEDIEEELLLTKTDLQTTTDKHSQTPKSKKGGAHAKPLQKLTSSAYAENTPPPTDCFSSDFDLYDLIASSNDAGKGAANEDQLNSNKMSNPNLYSSVALQNYFRKRKSLKSNRTGWPKAQKKKTTTAAAQKHQHGLRQKIRFLHKNDPLGSSVASRRDKKADSMNVKAELDEDASSHDAAPAREEQKKHRRKSGGIKTGVITPPDSEADDGRPTTNVNYDEEYLDNTNDAQLQINEAESVNDREEAETVGDEDDGETMADSIEIERCCPMDIDADAAAEADIEAADEDDDDEEDDDDDDDDDLHRGEAAQSVPKRVELPNVVVTDDETTTMFMDQRNPNRSRHSTIADASPNDFKHMGRLSLNHADGTGATSSLTSTPTTTGTGTTAATGNMLRGLRRTPVLLNGSLGSCISPSEKAGDNSDIFTVSSDGLDTDLDQSNSHLQYRAGEDEQQQQNEAKSCPHRTPKRKYDISKYAPNGRNSRTCAAEAATAAVKSLAISQFLKKEVRVTCRRLRQPFRRFRFRR